jgi:hypothetical protein
MLMTDKISSLKAYLPAIFRSLWVWVVGGLGGVLGVIDLTTGRLRVPLWVWLISGGTVLFVAQFLAFHKERKLRKELQEAAEPKLNIEFSNSSSEPFYFGRPKTAHSNASEVYRVRVANRSSVTVKNVQLAVSEIQPKPKEFFALPFFLQPLHAEHRILDPGGEMFFNVAIHHDHTPSKVIIGHELSLDTYTVKLTATGENVPSVSSKFRIHVYTGRLYMFPVSA